MSLMKRLHSICPNHNSWGTTACMVFDEDDFWEV